jgi:chorismate dehydratase
LKKIKVGIVNYLNTAPLIYGLQNGPVMNEIELIPDYPSNLADGLINGSIDVGLVPVAVIPHLDQWWLVGNHCIGADGSVASVCIFSEVPIENVTKIILDYQSRTSVELAKVLVTDYWKLNVALEDAVAGFEDQVKGTTAALIIGDRALKQRKVSPYCYDLAEAWKNFTGLPFVFAAWVSNKPLDERFVKMFDDANAYGVKHIAEVTASLDNDLFDLDEYFRKHISYSLDANKKKALKKFLQYLDYSINVPV